MYNMHSFREKENFVFRSLEKFFELVIHIKIAMLFGDDGIRHKVIFYLI